MWDLFLILNFNFFFQTQTSNVCFMLIESALPHVVILNKINNLKSAT